MTEDRESVFLPKGLLEPVFHDREVLIVVTGEPALDQPAGRMGRLDFAAFGDGRCNVAVVYVEVGPGQAQMRYVALTAANVSRLLWNATRDRLEVHLTKAEWEAAKR